MIIIIIDCYYKEGRKNKINLGIKVGVSIRFTGINIPRKYNISSLRFLPRIFQFTYTNFIKTKSFKHKTNLLVNITQSILITSITSK